MTGPVMPSTNEGLGDEGVREEVKEDIYIYQVRPVVPADRRPDIQVTVKAVTNNEWNQQCFKIPVRSETTLSEARRRLGRKPKAVLGTLDYAFLARGKHIPQEKEATLRVIDILPKLLKDLPQQDVKRSNFLFRGNDGQPVEYRKVPLEIGGKRELVLCAGILNIVARSLQLHEVEVRGFSFIPLDATSYIDGLHAEKRLDLFCAATADRINDVTSIIGDLQKKGQAIEAVVDHLGATPLHHAAKRGLLEVCDALLSHSPELVHAQDNNDRISLHYALMRRHYDVAWLFIQKESGVRIKDRFGVTCLSLIKTLPDEVLLKFMKSDDTEFGELDPGLVHICLEVAVREKDVSFISKTLPFSEDVDERNDIGLTLLHEAVIAQRPNLQNLDKRNDNGATFMQEAEKAKQADLEVVRVLVQGCPCLINMYDSNGYLPIHYASKRGCSEMIPILINDQVSNGDLNYAITCALSRKKFSAVSALFDTKYLILDFETIDFLIIAIERNWVESKTILGNCPEPYICTYFLSLAASEGDTDLLQSLLKNGANINFQDLMGRSALHEAAQRGHMDSLEILLGTSEVELNLQDCRGSTALHYACAKNEADAVQRLVTEEAVQVDLNDDFGRTPFLVALYSKGFKAARTLIQHALHRINPTKTDKSGRNFYHFAQYFEEDVLSLLQSALTSMETNRGHTQVPQERTKPYRPLKISENVLDFGCIGSHEVWKQRYGHFFCYVYRYTYMLCSFGYPVRVPISESCFSKSYDCHVDNAPHEGKCFLLPFTQSKNCQMTGRLCPDCNLITCCLADDSKSSCECGANFVDIWFDIDILEEEYQYQKHHAAPKYKSKHRKGAFKSHAFKPTTSESPLHQAVLSNSPSAYKWLRHTLDDILFKDEFGRTPLLLAIDSLRSDMVKCILNAHSFTSEEQHLLHRALNLEIWTEEERISQYQIVSFLLESGCDPFEPKKDFVFCESLLRSLPVRSDYQVGPTAFQVASCLGLNDILGLFLDKSPSMLDAVGFCMAAQNGNGKTVKILSTRFIATCEFNKDAVHETLCSGQSSILRGLQVSSVKYDNLPVISKSRYPCPPCSSIMKILEIYEAAGSPFDLSPLEMTLMASAPQAEIESTVLRTIGSPSYRGGDILGSLCTDMLMTTVKHQWRIALALMEKHGTHRLWFCVKHCQAPATDSTSIHKGSVDAEFNSNPLESYRTSGVSRHSAGSYEDRRLHGDWVNSLMVEILCLAAHPIAPEELLQKLLYNTCFELNKNQVLKHVRMAVMGGRKIYQKYKQHWTAHVAAITKLIRICPVVLQGMDPFLSDHNIYNKRHLSPDQIQFFHTAISMQNIHRQLGCDIISIAIATGDRDIIDRAIRGLGNHPGGIPKNALEMACYAGDHLTVKDILSMEPQLPVGGVQMAALLAFGKYNGVKFPFDSRLSDQWPWTAISEMTQTFQRIFQRLQSKPTENVTNRATIIEMLCDRMDISGVLQDPRCVQNLLVAACLNGLTDPIGRILNRTVLHDCSWLWPALQAAVVSGNQVSAIAVLKYMKEKSIKAPVDKICLTAILNAAANLRQWEFIQYLCLNAQTSVPVDLDLSTWEPSWIHNLVRERFGSWIWPPLKILKPLLHLACEEDQYEIVHFLLQKQDPQEATKVVNGADIINRHPLDYALTNCHSKLALLLLIYGAQPSPNRTYVGFENAIRFRSKFSTESSVVQTCGHLSTKPQKMRISRKALKQNCEVKQEEDKEKTAKKKRVEHTGSKMTTYFEPLSADDLADTLKTTYETSFRCSAKQYNKTSKLQGQSKYQTDIMLSLYEIDYGGCLVAQKNVQLNDGFEIGTKPTSTYRADYDHCGEKKGERASKAKRFESNIVPFGGHLSTKPQKINPTRKALKKPYEIKPNKPKGKKITIPKKDHEGKEMVSYFKHLSKDDILDAFCSTYRTSFKFVVNKEGDANVCRPQENMESELDILLSLYEIDYGRRLAPQNTKTKLQFSNGLDSDVKNTHETCVDYEKSHPKHVTKGQDRVVHPEVEMPEKKINRRTEGDKRQALNNEKEKVPVERVSRAREQIIKTSADTSLEYKALRRALQYLKGSLKWGSLLHAACAHGDLDLVDKILVERPSIINKHDMKNRTPLFCAAFNGHNSVVNRLIGGGAALDDGCNVLLAALMHLCKRRFLMEGWLYDTDRHYYMYPENRAQGIRAKCFNSITKYFESHNDMCTLCVGAEVTEYNDNNALELVQMVVSEQTLTDSSRETLCFVTALLGEQSICDAIIRHQEWGQFAPEVGGDCEHSFNFVDTLISIYLIRIKRHLYWSPVILQKQEPLMMDMINKFHYLPHPSLLPHLVLYEFWSVVLATVQNLGDAAEPDDQQECILYLVMLKASEKNQSDTVKAVLTHLSGEWYMVPALQLSILNKSREVCALLIKEGADPKTRLTSGQKATSDKKLQQSGQQSALKHKLRAEWSAFHMVCAMGDLDLLNLMALEIGQDLKTMLHSFANELRRELLFICASYGQKDMLITLLESGWNVDDGAGGDLPRISTRFKGTSLLETASVNGHESICMHLITEKYNPSLELKVLSNILLSACARGMVRLIDVIVKEYSQHPSKSDALIWALLSNDAGAIGDFPSKPVVYAHAMGHYEIVDKLQLWLIENAGEDTVPNIPALTAEFSLRNHMRRVKDRKRSGEQSHTDEKTAWNRTATDQFISTLHSHKYTDSWNGWFSHRNLQRVFKNLPSDASLAFVENIPKDLPYPIWEDVIVAAIQYNRKDTFENILHHRLFQENEESILSSGEVLQEACLAKDDHYLKALNARGSMNYLTEPDQHGVSPIAYAAAMGKRHILASLPGNILVDQHSHHGVDEDGIEYTYSPHCTLCSLMECRGWRNGSFFTLTQSSSDGTRCEMEPKVFMQPVSVKSPLSPPKLNEMQHMIKGLLMQSTKSKHLVELIFPVSNSVEVNTSVYSLSSSEDKNNALVHCINCSDENSFMEILKSLDKDDIDFKRLLNEAAACGKNNLFKHLIRTFDITDLQKATGSPNPLEVAVAFGNTKLAFYIIQTFSQIPCRKLQSVFQYCDGTSIDDEDEDIDKEVSEKNYFHKDLVAKECFLKARWIIGENRPGDEAWNLSMMRQKSSRLSHPDVWLAARFTDEEVDILEAARPFKSYILPTTLQPSGVNVDFKGLSPALQIDELTSKVQIQSTLIMQSVMDDIVEDEEGKLKYTPPAGSPEILKKLAISAILNQKGKHDLKRKRNGELEMTVVILQDDVGTIESQRSLQDDILVAKKEIEGVHVPYLINQLQEMLGLQVKVSIGWNSFDIIKDKAERLNAIRKFAGAEASSECSFGGFMETLHHIRYWMESITDMWDTHTCESFKKSCPAIRDITFRYATDVRDDVPFKDMKTMLDQKSVAWLFNFAPKAKKLERNQGVAIETTSCNRGAFAPFVYCRIFHKALIDLYTIVQVFHNPKGFTVLDDKNVSKEKEPDANPLQLRIEWLSASHIGKPHDILRFIDGPLKNAMMSAADNFMRQNHIEARFEYLHLQFSPKADQKAVVKGGTSIRFILGVSRDCITKIELPDFHSSFFAMQNDELKASDRTRQIKQYFADRMQEVAKDIKMKSHLPSLTLEIDYKALVEQAASWSNEYYSNPVEAVFDLACRYDRVELGLFRRLSMIVYKFGSMYEALGDKNRFKTHFIDIPYYPFHRRVQPPQNRRLHFLKRIHNLSGMVVPEKEMVVRRGGYLWFIQKGELAGRRQEGVTAAWDVLSVEEILRDYSKKSNSHDDIELVLYGNVTYRIAGSAGALELIKMLPTKIIVCGSRKPDTARDNTSLVICNTSSWLLPADTFAVPNGETISSQCIQPRIATYEREASNASVTIGVDSQVFMSGSHGSSNIEQVLDFIDYLTNCEDILSGPVSPDREKKPFPIILSNKTIQSIRIMQSEEKKGQNENPIRVGVFGDCLMFFLSKAKASWEDIQVAYTKHIIRCKSEAFAKDLSAVMKTGIDASNFDFRCENDLVTMAELRSFYSNLHVIFRSLETSLCFLTQHCSKWRSNLKGVKSICFTSLNKQSKDRRTLQVVGQVLHCCFPLCEVVQKRHSFLGVSQLAGLLTRNSFDSPKDTKDIASVAMPAETVVTKDTLTNAYYCSCMKETSFVIQGRNVFRRRVEDCDDKSHNLDVDIYNADDSLLPKENFDTEKIASCEWKVTWKPNNGGIYRIHAKLFDQHIKGSPFRVHVTGDLSEVNIPSTNHPRQVDLAVNLNSQIPIVFVHPEPQTSPPSCQDSNTTICPLSASFISHMLKRNINRYAYRSRGSEINKGWQFEDMKMCLLMYRCRRGSVTLEDGHQDGNHEIALLKIRDCLDDSIVTFAPYCRHCVQPLGIVTSGVIKRPGTQLTLLVGERKEGCTRENSSISNSEQE